ncbi:MAG TPA: ABC transporter ATP-binding protein, partial [Planctomycetaceae bacterium]|nr:ABC transporter ATP-binding protein [Planctomycetaceae bacterium]
TSMPAPATLPEPHAAPAAAPPTAPPLLEVADLRKRFGDLVAVDGVSFHVEAGEVLGLLGPNGAGKSTTVLMIAGLLRPDSGEVRLDGQTLRPECRKLRKVLGMAPQDLAIYPELTARENLRFFGRLYGLKGGDLDSRIEHALERTGLAGRADDATRTYSGGMKRRLNFGIALLHRPRLLILDEPTVGVDPQSRSHLLDGVRQLRDEGVAVIYVSHYMEEVQAVCNRVAIIDYGRMLACDALESLLGRMRSNLVLRIAGPTATLRKALEGLADLEEAEDGTASIIISRDQHRDEATLNATLARVTALLAECRVHLHAVETHEPNLERLFLKLTGHRLRD